MTNIQVFNFNSSDVNVQIDDEGNPWFNAKDVCDALDIQNSARAVKERVDEEDARIQTVYRNIGSRDTYFINESGVIALVISSRKPEAKKFKKWVTTEVIPSIRKTGSYISKTPSKKEYAAMLFEAEERAEQLALKVEQVTEQRDYHIHSKGAVVRINNEMNLQIGAAHNYAAVGKVMKAVPANHKLKKINPSRIGKTLVQFSNILGHQVIKVSLNALTEVNAYHKDVWMNAYNISIEELFPRTLKKKIMKASETGENDLINF